MQPQKILLVEDDALIADLLQLILEDAGHKVILARDGHVAMVMANDISEAYEILITDIRLPGPDGWTVARSVRAILPTIAVIYISGEATSDWSEYGVPGSVIMQKPFARAAVLGAISELTV